MVFVKEQDKKSINYLPDIKNINYCMCYLDDPEDKAFRLWMAKNGLKTKTIALRVIVRHLLDIKEQKFIGLKEDEKPRGVKYD
jgi:hypothetical protein